MCDSGRRLRDVARLVSVVVQDTSAVLGAIGVHAYRGDEMRQAIMEAEARVWEELDAVVRVRGWEADARTPSSRCRSRYSADREHVCSSRGHTHAFPTCTASASSRFGREKLFVRLTLSP